MDEFESVIKGIDNYNERISIKVRENGMTTLIMTMLGIYLMNKSGLLEWAISPSYSVKSIQRNIEWDSFNKAKLDAELNRLTKLIRNG